MLIQVNTDHNIEGGEELTGAVEEVVEATLGRFGNQVTRVEVHLTDESSTLKSSDDDKRCVMEARLAGMQPITVSSRGATIEQAIDGAADKLEKTIDRTIGRLKSP